MLTDMIMSLCMCVSVCELHDKLWLRVISILLVGVCITGHMAALKAADVNRRRLKHDSLESFGRTHTVIHDNRRTKANMTAFHKYEHILAIYICW